MWLLKNNFKNTDLLNRDALSFVYTNAGDIATLYFRKRFSHMVWVPKCTCLKALEIQQV